MASSANTFTTLQPMIKETYSDQVKKPKKKKKRFSKLKEKLSGKQS